ncbi:PDC sensor domain-containing protein [Campylobacter coli]
MYITPAYIDAVSNEYAITYSKALYKDGNSHYKNDSKRRAEWSSSSE